MRRFRLHAIAGLAGARLAVASLSLGGLLIACGTVPGPAPAGSPPPPTAAVPAATTPTAAASLGSVRVPTTTTPIVTAESLPAGAALVGHASTPVEIYELPELAAPSRVFEAVTELGSPRVFLVEAGPVDGWIEVLLPVRPNGTSGWVRAGSVELHIVDQAIVVDLSGRRLRLEQDNEVVLETEIAIGSPNNPTPTGTYFVTDVVQLADPTGPWGPFALGLSAFSDTITEFNGGDGIIGIHGTNRPASIGQPVSLGCVRVPNEIAARLAELVQLGTPVEIRG